MPKISIPIDGSNNPQLRPAIDEIQSMINHIEFVLEGRIDNENIWNEAGKTMAFSASRINDYAINTKPIEAPKFFSNFSSELSPYEKFQTLLSNVNDEYRVLQGTGSILFNKDSLSENGLTEYVEIEKPANYKLVNLKDFIEKKVLNNEESVNIDYGNGKTNLLIEDAYTSYLPHTIGSDYVITYDYFLDRFEDNYEYLKVVRINEFDLSVESVTKDKVTIRANVTTHGNIEKDEFVTFMFNVYVLFKELI